MTGIETPRDGGCATPAVIHSASLVIAARQKLDGFNPLLVQEHQTVGDVLALAHLVVNSMTSYVAIHHGQQSIVGHVGEQVAQFALPVLYFFLVD